MASKENLLDLSFRGARKQTIDYELYLDDRNRSLWDSLSKVFFISVASSVDDTYNIYTKGKTATICVPDAFPCKDSFTHELLHLYISQKQVFIGGNIKLQICDDPLLSIVLTDPLVQHLGNCLEHVKMLPIYLNMGFDRSKFILDYNIEKCKDVELDAIQYFLENGGTLWSYFVDQFIGKFIGMKACPNDSIDYSKKLVRIEQIDAKLFEILNNFWDRWERFDIELCDAEYSSYHDLNFDFLCQLKQWIINNYPETGSTV